MAEKAQPPRNSELYSIVVAGAMNPGIHHPFWYQQVELITQKEADEAVKADDFTVSLLISHFRIAGIDIQCQLRRWEIKTDQKDLTDRLLGIATRVFTLLDHTPVAAAGINVNVIRQASVSGVADILGEMISDVHLGLEGEGNRSAEISMNWSTRGRKLTVLVAPIAEAPSFVEIRNNAHYDQFPELLGSHFDLGAILGRHFHDDVTAAFGQADRVLHSLKQWRHHGR